MKNLAPLTIVAFIFLMFSGCRKDIAAPDITTLTVQNISFFSANCGGIVNSDGGAPILARGVCWSTSPAPTINDDTTVNMTDRHHFIAYLTGLTPETTYYLRAYATNEAGTAYGKEVFFTTRKGNLPEVITHQVINIYSVQASVTAEVVSDGGLRITERGICLGTAPLPTINNNKITVYGTTGSFNVKLSNLLPSDTYYLRAYAINAAGTVYGNEIQFSTPEPEPLPEVLTQETLHINQWYATAQGLVVNNWGAPVLEKGICWSRSPNPTKENNYKVDYSGQNTISIVLHKLLPVTTYYVRAYAINFSGIAYGNQQVFVTSAIGIACPGIPTVTDIDGNIYPTVQIGQYCWFRENLKTTRYRNGEPIPYSDQAIDSDAFNWYNNNPQWKDIYGGLYNWHAVASDKGLCPEGWQVPDYDAMNLLRIYANTAAYDAGISPMVSVLKCSRSEPLPHPRWDEGGVAGNDLMGFCATPAGMHYTFLGFRWMGLTAAWWSSTPSTPNAARYARIYNEFEDFFISGSYNTGESRQVYMSVRCVKE